jgi:nucleotide-binding universal stress UspA family protein
MFKTILVPLDGSHRSEQALPLALSVARRAGAKVGLVHVRKPPSTPVFDRDVPAAPVPSPNEKEYLGQSAGKIRQTSKLEVPMAVLEGPIAATLAEHARGVGADLMVLTTHGRGPLSRFWMGSVADELIRHGSVPLLVQRPTDDSPPPLDRDLKPEHLLIALDGSKLSEAVLQPAIALARVFKAHVTLFRVVELPPVLTPDGIVPLATVLDVNLLEELKTQARTYLEAIADPLRSEDLRVDTRIAIDDRIAGAILDEASAFELVAVATHGRSKFARAMLGSVADKVVRGAAMPVLVVRPTKA